MRRTPSPPLDEYDSRPYQCAETYCACAKDLCENCGFDLREYRFCVKESACVAITADDFDELKKDLRLLNDARKTVLAEYKDYFRERFVKRTSNRKYAEAHQINRGGADDLRKKLFAALARLLKKRDEAEGKCRLRKPAPN